MDYFLPAEGVPQGAEVEWLYNLHDVYSLLTLLLHWINVEKTENRRMLSSLKLSQKTVDGFVRTDN